MQDQIPLLTDIIKVGDKSKAGLHNTAPDQPELELDTSAQILNEPFDFSIEDETEVHIATPLQLSQQIENAIDAVLPDIKRQLHDQLLEELTKS